MSSRSSDLRNRRVVRLTYLLSGMHGWFAKEYDTYLLSGRYG